MMDLNLDYLSKQMLHNQRLKALKGFHDRNIENMVNLINLIYRKHQQYHLGVSFLRISVSKRVRVQKLLMIQSIIKRWSEHSFIQIKRFAVLSNKTNQIKAENKFNYPLVIINKIFNVNRTVKLQEGWQKILRQKSHMKIVENRLDQMVQLCDKYQQRILIREFFCIFRRVLDRKNESLNHILNFEKVFQTIKSRKLFDILTQLVVKSKTKVIGQLQKQKSGKRDESVNANSKRSQLVNELKRKTNNLKGQLTQQIMRNNKKRTDGARQNGSKLMKKNEQQRGIEMSMTQILSDIERMERQIARKQNFINNRPKVGVPYEFLRGIYLQFSDDQGQKLSKNQVESKIAKGKLNQFANSPNCITTDNIKLKFLINLYEQFQSSKKSDSYMNLDIQNRSLKSLIGSLIRMQYFQPKREKIMKGIDEINSNFGQLKMQMSQLRVEKLQSRKK